MRVKALAVSRECTALRLLASFRLLMDARSDWPHLRPLDFMTPGTYPKARWQVKLYCLAMHPGKAWRARPQDLALDAAGLLERRRGVWLDWAAGCRKSGAVWLFIKPWAWDRETGRRVWFRPGPEDLAALRALCPSEKGFSRIREEERGR